MDRHKTKDKAKHLQQQSRRDHREVLDAYKTHTSEWSAERKSLYVELERYEQIHNRLQQDYDEVELWLELYTTELLNDRRASQDKPQQAVQDELKNAQSKWRQTYEQLTTLQVKNQTILEQKVEENQQLKDSLEKVKQELGQQRQAWIAEMARCKKAEAVLETVRQESATQQQSWSAEKAKTHTQLQREIFENNQTRIKLAQAKQALKDTVEQEIVRRDRLIEETAQAKAKQENTEVALWQLHKAQQQHEQLWDQSRKKLESELESSRAETQRLKAALDEVYLNFEEQSQNWQDKQEQLTHEHQQMKTQLQEAYRESQQREKKVAGKSVTLDPMIFHLDDILVKGDRDI